MNVGQYRTETGPVAHNVHVEQDAKLNTLVVCFTSKGVTECNFPYKRATQAETVSTFMTDIVRVIDNKVMEELEEIQRINRHYGPPIAPISNHLAHQHHPTQQGQFTIFTEAK